MNASFTVPKPFVFLCMLLFCNIDIYKNSLQQSNFLGPIGTSLKQGTIHKEKKHCTHKMQGLIGHGRVCTFASQTAKPHLGLNWASVNNHFAFCCNIDRFILSYLMNTD